MWFGEKKNNESKQYGFNRNSKLLYILSRSKKQILEADWSQFKEKVTILLN